ncbi:dephospho-CoA kinase [Fructobacillus parabroussonetiae]|uniref:Dephospho-CoA kinase n=1 Tax=Fructobacillus parabroussonetiae TaxID=2713174 RepID=A0ABS5QXM3_9LACO|nr:dephospho-CoA kinase [Fructobacillus parabroussonetiae]MBS9337943.1 dephospho-CoA kinase [Fructobacillus parabroussonetiae]MCK8617857.1 dephospho-CoA kinase [Fructobacillus parabroussonetiae]
MKVIAITGGIASGKSAVTDQIRQAGYRVVDADLLARQVVEPGTHTLEEIKEAFGQEIVQNGVLDRKALGEKVFANPALLKELTKITSPEIQSAIRDQLAFFKMKEEPIVFCAIPLFFEQHYEKTGWFDQVLVVSASEREQLERLMARDHLDEWAAQSRIKSQMPVQEKIAKADVVIENNGTAEELAQKVQDYLKHLEVA